MAKYVLVDGNYQLYRSSYSGNKKFASHGLYTGGTIVFLQMLKNLSNIGKPIVIFDHSRALWRTQIYPEYKKRKPQTEEDKKKKEILFDSTFSLLLDLIPKLGVPLVRIPDQEGDDVLFRLAQGLVDQGHQVTAATDDSDYLQLLKHGIQIYQPMKGLYWTGKEVYEHEKGFNLHSFVLKKCLMGDSSDNISNPPGIGPAGADKIIQELKEYNIKGIFDWLESQPNSKLKDKLRPHTHIIKRNWLLTNLESIPLTTTEVMYHYECALSSCVPDYKYILSAFKKLEITNLSFWLVYVAEKMRKYGSGNQL